MFGAREKRGVGGGGKKGKKDLTIGPSKSLLNNKESFDANPNLSSQGRKNENGRKASYAKHQGKSELRKKVDVVFLLDGGRGGEF